MELACRERRPLWSYLQGPKVERRQSEDTDVFPKHQAEPVQKLKVAVPLPTEAICEAVLGRKACM